MKNSYSIGIMQGRLSDKPGQALQSFPWDDWKKEFERASSIGFSQIEWLIDGGNDNPISSKDGQREILNLSRKYNITVKSLCAHSLMDGELLSGNTLKIKNAQDNFLQILSWALAINVDFIILPVMDAMSIQSNSARERLKKVLREIITTSHPMILLESDLPAQQLKLFIDDVGLDNLGVLYDLGNATALGFDVKAELNLLHRYVKEVHIKDRFKNNGRSTRLGEANTQFNVAIQVLKQLSWKGSFILETPIFSDWSIEAHSNYKFISSLIDEI